MKYKAYINGEFIDSKDSVEIISPLNLKVLGEVPSLDVNQINNAFNYANNSFSFWKNLSTKERILYINEFTIRLNKEKNSLAKLMEKEIGKNFKDSLSEIDRSIEYINKTINEWNKMEKSEISTIGNIKNVNMRVPLGVVLAISPFNYPINLSLSKIIPSLLVGNTIVFKPATNGSLVGCYLAKIFDDCKFPKGVFNLVTGKGSKIGDALISNEFISLIHFTGSVNVGKGIAKNTSMIPLVLELGGNDASYVRYDADIQKAVIEIEKGAFDFSGQRCTAIKRLILHKSIANEFIEALISKVQTRKMDPMISEAASIFAEKLILDSKKRKDVFLLEGNIKKNHITPFIIQTTKESEIWKQEQFAPILPIIIIDDENELSNLFNDTNFGLQNSIFTKDIKWAYEISNSINSGTVNINKSSSRSPDEFPFSGIKDSGFGVQGIKETLLSTTRIFNIKEKI